MNSWIGIEAELNLIPIHEITDINHFLCLRSPSKVKALLVYLSHF
ncbi:hypothetical protein [Nostoc piscinale]